MGDVEARIAHVEAMVETLVHFIHSELRPDLSASALRYQSQNLAQGDVQAKIEKDQKDSERY
jgi:hypothetical protein